MAGAAIVAELAGYEYLKLAAVGAEAHGARLRIPAWWMLIATAFAFVVTLPNFPVDAQLPVLSGLTLLLFAWNGFTAPLIQVLPDTAQGLFGLIWIGQLHVQAIDLQQFTGAPWLLYKTIELLKSLPSQYLAMLPYLATVVVLVLISRNKRLTMMNTPASLGQPFVPDR